MKAVLFLGPSRPSGIEIPDGIEVQPPASAGDIYQAVQKGYRLIGLVDAQFHDLQTVQHKEILYALQAGIPVWGAASMGALRAAECACFGMQGFGHIFADYRDAVLVDDHEVALIYGPAELGYPALSEPLVNIRATLRTAELSGILSPGDAASILQVAQSLFYRDLTWSALAAACSSPTLARSVRTLQNHRVDQKKVDSGTLIAAMGDAIKGGLQPHRAHFQLQRTHHWHRFMERYRWTEAGLAPSEAAILDEVRLSPLTYRDLLLRAFARSALESEGQERNTQELMDTLRADHGLGSAASLKEWLNDNETELTRVTAFMAMDETLEESLDQASGRLAGMLLEDLRIDGAYADLRERARRKSAALADRSYTMPPSFADQDLTDLLTWFSRQKGLELPTEDPDSLAQSLGLKDRIALHQLLRREFDFLRLQGQDR